MMMKDCACTTGTKRLPEIQNKHSQLTLYKQPLFMNSIRSRCGRQFSHLDDVLVHQTQREYGVLGGDALAFRGETEPCVSGRRAAEVVHDLSKGGGVRHAELLH